MIIAYYSFEFIDIKIIWMDYGVVNTIHSFKYLIF